MQQFFVIQIIRLHQMFRKCTLIQATEEEKKQQTQWNSIEISTHRNKKTVQSVNCSYTRRTKFCSFSAYFALYFFTKLIHLIQIICWIGCLISIFWFSHFRNDLCTGKIFILQKEASMSYRRAQMCFVFDFSYDRLKWRKALYMCTEHSRIRLY